MTDDDTRKPAPEATIKVRKNGPYLVVGGVPLTRKSPVVSEHGEPLTWRTESLDDRPTYALCRCGGSEMKPFCDGTHASIGFDGTETASVDSYVDRAESLGGTGIEVFDDRGICVHAGFCGNKVSNVWKMAANTDDTVVRAQVMAMVEKCPSGALTFAVGGEVIEPDLPEEVAVVPDGPLWVSGGLPIQRSDGGFVETRQRVTLCRCGVSSTKPLCDGSHKDAGFIG